MCGNGFLVVDSWRGVAEEAIRVFVVWSGRARDHYASETGDWKHRSGKDQVIAHMKARSKHSLLTETASDLKKKKLIRPN